MSTPNLVGLVLRGLRCGTLHHCESDPEHPTVGAKVADFIISLDEEQRRAMVANLDMIEWTDVQDEDELVPDNIRDQYDEAGIWTPGSGDRNETTWSELLCDMQGVASLQYILNGTLEHLVDESGVEDECEWSYRIDFEAETLQMGRSGRAKAERLLSH